MKPAGSIEEEMKEEIEIGKLYDKSFSFVLELVRNMAATIRVLVQGCSVNEFGQFMKLN